MRPRWHFKTALPVMGLLPVLKALPEFALGAPERRTCHELSRLLLTLSDDGPRQSMEQDPGISGLHDPLEILPRIA